MSFEEKQVQEVRYRDQLLDDLLNQQFVYSSGPYEAHIQFSNFCNMSCIMCWDGRNPPTEKAPPKLLEKISQQVAPHLSVITPYSGSEPLVLSWNETREMAVDKSVLLCITTNCQYLDEKLFNELVGITETLFLSIDSHIPEVMEIIRPGGNIKKVFENLATTARLSKQHNVECIVNLVLLTHNAPHLSETIEYLADLGIETVNVIQMLDVNGRSGYLDPLLHFSQEYIAWVKQRCLDAAKAKQIRLIWSVTGCYQYDYRPSSFVPPLDRKSWNDENDDRMRRMFPGFCRNVFNRPLIDRHGIVAPCCYATQGQLSLGNLNELDFDQIWNGSSAQDLRRGMLTGDVPTHCSSCRYIDVISPLQELEFATDIDAEFSRNRRGSSSVEPLLRASDRQHGNRFESAPELRLRHLGHPIKEFHFAFSLAGESEEVHREILQPSEVEDGILSFQIPEDLWAKFKTNVGYWWNVWAVPEDRRQPIFRFPDHSVMIRHQAIPRISGSQLKYTSDGSLPIIDLGVSKELGWATPDLTPSRPETLVSPQKRRGSNLAKASTEKQNSKQGGLWNRIVGRRSIRNDLQEAILDGYLDKISEEREYIHIVGWLLLKTGPADSIKIVTDSGKTIKAQPVVRPDIEMGFPQLVLSCNSGFEAKIKRADITTEFGYQFSIIAVHNEETVCRINIERITTPGESALIDAGPWWFGNSANLTIR